MRTNQLYPAGDVCPRMCGVERVMLPVSFLLDDGYRAVGTGTVPVELWQNPMTGGTEPFVAVYPVNGRFPALQITDDARRRLLAPFTPASCGESLDSANLPDWLTNDDPTVPEWLSEDWAVVDDSVPLAMVWGTVAVLVTVIWLLASWMGLTK